MRRSITGETVEHGGSFNGRRDPAGPSAVPVGCGRHDDHAQLLDWFLKRRDEAAEDAFEELMIRHGPMVLRVCRSVLKDPNDAEDAFQAVFLVLANRAGSIRRQGVLASWLFGVAQRVACRARSRAARSRALDRIAAERTGESYLPPESNPDGEILHQEIADLPERLRAPLVLCYLEGLTYEAAARQLAVTEGTVRGRLGRARERLRGRLIGAGVAVPAGLLAAGATARAQGTITAATVHSTTRIAQGFMAGHTATVLARGVLKAMLMNQLKAMTALLVFGIASGYGLWHVMASPVNGAGRIISRPAAGRTAHPQSPGTTPQDEARPATYRMEGSVRVEGTGEPVEGVKWQVYRTDPGQLSDAVSEVIATGADGRFAIDGPAGHVRYYARSLPAGYWCPELRSFADAIALGADPPPVRREIVVRKGTIWDFRFVAVRTGGLPAGTSRDRFGGSSGRRPTIAAWCA